MVGLTAFESWAVELDVETISSLLPGDAAPQLKTSIDLLSGERTQPIVFIETTFVALWNAGCSGRELSFGFAHTFSASGPRDLVLKPDGKQRR